MAKRNGGIIGPSNVPNPFIAKGVWKLRDAFNYIKAGLWPSVLGYQVNNSLRFDSGSSDELTRTFGTETSRKIFTISYWIKVVSIGSQSHFFGDTAGTTDATQDSFYFGGNNQFIFGGWNANIITSTMLFRDVGAWYHIVVGVDTTQATSADRVKFYVNGTAQTYTSGAAYPSQNADFGITKSGNHSWFGNDGQSARGRGYLAEAYLIDGQQLTPSSFGQTDATTGIWTPIAYTGSFGNNGFYLQFKNSAALGTDSSGNGNNFTVNNLTSVDQSTDTPTNNFATLNPLVPTPSATWSQGNLRLTGTSSAAFDQTNFYTIGVDSGKWYTEVKYITAGTNTYNPYVGVAPISSSATANLTGAGSQFVCIRFDNEKYFNASATGSYFASSISVNDIIQVALDMDNGKVWFGKNGTFVGSPTAGTSEAGSGLNVTTMTFAIRVGDAVLEINSGNPPYSVTGGYTDAGGFGNFSYQPPSGFYSLCTRTLAAFG